jgi:hypothetical protein
MIKMRLVRSVDPCVNAFRSCYTDRAILPPGLGALVSLLPWVYGLRGLILPLRMIPYFVQKLVVSVLALIDLEDAKLEKPYSFGIWPPSTPRLLKLGLLR